RHAPDLPQVEVQKIALRLLGDRPRPAFEGLGFAELLGQSHAVPRGLAAEALEGVLIELGVDQQRFVLGLAHRAAPPPIDQHRVEAVLETGEVGRRHGQIPILKPWWCGASSLQVSSILETRAPGGPSRTVSTSSRSFAASPSAST